jgi:hypothetical protein
MPEDKRRFIAWCGNEVQLRIEQIGPNQWSGWVLRRPGQAIERTIYWPQNYFKARTESGIKHGAITTVSNLYPEFERYLDQLHWRDLSDLADEAWWKEFVEFLPPGADPYAGG